MGHAQPPGFAELFARLLIVGLIVLGLFLALLALWE